MQSGGCSNHPAAGLVHIALCAVPAGPLLSSVIFEVPLGKQQLAASANDEYLSTNHSQYLQMTLRRVCVVSQAEFIKMQQQ